MEMISHQERPSFVADKNYTQLSENFKEGGPNYLMRIEILKVSNFMCLFQRKSLLLSFINFFIFKVDGHLEINIKSYIYEIIYIKKM